MVESTSTPTNKRYACATCGDEFEGDQTTCPFDGTTLTLIAQKLSPGSVLAGRFEIVDAIGDGGMGTVYKATHKLMKRNVAIKTIQSAGMSGAALKRFQQESQALSVLNHPNILSVFDFFIGEDGQPYLVMDYLQGTTLEEIRQTSGPMHWQRAVPIFEQACRALAHAHSHGIIHRDIKPSNIMLVESEGGHDMVKIVDFGIAKLRAEDETSQLTATGDTFGSPQYMSPEQCHAHALDARSDIYSLGCVMYATLTGKPPFESDDSMELMYKQTHDAPKPFTAELGCPAALEAVVIKSLAKEPEERWQSADAMETALSSLSSLAATPCVAARVSAPAAGRCNPSRIPLTLIAAGVLAVIAVAGLALASMRSTHPEPAAAIPAPTIAATHAVDSPSAPRVVPPVQTPEQIYTTSMAAGKKAFAAHDYEQAQQYFDKAHQAAENFGEVDQRFLDSMEWQGNVAEKLGDYNLARQARQYCREIRERKRHH